MSEDIKELVKRLRDHALTATRDECALAIEGLAGERDHHFADACRAWKAKFDSDEMRERQRVALVKDCEAVVRRLKSAEAERDRTRADYEAMKAHNKELFGKLSDATAERDRLKAALQRIASQKSFAELEAGTEDDDVDYDLVGAWDIVIGVARKALGDAS